MPMLETSELIFLVTLSVIYIIPAFYFSKGRKYRFVFLVFFTLFFIYILKVLSVTQSGFMPNSNIYINLIPLIELRVQDFKTSMLNIIMFVPFGFLLPFLAQINWRGVFYWSLAFSFCLEMGQLILALYVGGTYRVIDINDVIFNTLGAMVGYGFYVVFMRVFWLIYRKREV